MWVDSIHEGGGQDKERRRGKEERGAKRVGERRDGAEVVAACLGGAAAIIGALPPFVLMNCRNARRER